MENNRKEKITSEMTVRDINMKYPAAMTVFDKYGIAGCGGKYGPPESLNFFAQAHKVDCQQLIDDLEKVIEGGRVETVVIGADRVKEESTLYRGFVKAAIICTLTGGAALGVLVLTYIVVRGGFDLFSLTFTQTHANIQIYGWVGLFIMGFAYHAIPRFKNTPLRLVETAFLSLVLILTSLLMRSIAQPMVQHGPLFGGMFVSSGILLLLGYLAFISSMVVTVWKADSETEFYEKFIIASLIWGFVSVLYNLVTILWMVDQKSGLIDPEITGILRHIQFYGFMAMMIIGVSYRLLPSFMGVDAANRKTAGWVFALFNFGILLWLTAAIAKNDQLSILASGVELLAVLVAVISLNIFKPKRIVVEIGGISPCFDWYIRVAYIWLIVAVVMMTGGTMHEVLTRSPQTHAFIDAYRHALAMGFVTTMIFGVAQRILPVWEGKSIYSMALMLWVFVLITVGNAVRIIFQSIDGSPFGDNQYLIAGGGFLQFAGVLLFSFNIWRTLNLEEDPVIEEERGEAPAAGDTLPETGTMFGPKTKVFEILHEHPGAKEVLEKLGIRGLPDGEDGRSVPKFLTLERICRSSDVEIEEAIAALEEYCRGGAS